MVQRPAAPDSVEALKEFAMRGGAVSFFLGSATNPADFAALAGSGLFPGKNRAGRSARVAGDPKLGPRP